MRCLPSFRHAIHAKGIKIHPQKRSLKFIYFFAICVPVKNGQIHKISTPKIRKKTLMTYQIQGDEKRLAY
jgi:hypothetical protein